MPNSTSDHLPWRISRTDFQWWTDSPQHCYTCGDQDRLILEVNGEIICQEQGISCTNEAIPIIAQYLRQHPDVPHWARNGYPMVHDRESPPESLFIPGPSSCIHRGTIAAGSFIEGQSGTVMIDQKVLAPRRSLEVQNHSPSGFAWGYGGSGPAQLALALLLEAGASNREAIKYHQDFKRETVAVLHNQEMFAMTGEQVLDWLYSKCEITRAADTRR